MKTATTIVRIVFTVGLIVLALAGHKWVLYLCLALAVIDAEVKSYMLSKLWKERSPIKIYSGSGDIEIEFGEAK